MANIVTQGDNVIRAHLDHLAAHNEQDYLEQARQFLREQGIPLPEARRRSRQAPSAAFQGLPEAAIRRSGVPTGAARVADA